MPQKAKTTFKLLRPEDVWHPKSGPPLKNRNAVKTGLHTAEMRALRKAIQHVRRRARAAIARVDGASAFHLPTQGEVKIYARAVMDGRALRQAQDEGPAVTLMAKKQTGPRNAQPRMNSAEEDRKIRSTLRSIP